jgi:hypothetical protein
MASKKGTEIVHVFLAKDARGHTVNVKWTTDAHYRGGPNVVPRIAEDNIKLYI